MEKYDLPKLKSGEQVGQSNYERIAWLKEGIKLVADNPLGVGFDRLAFGHALKVKFGERGRGHSHSSLIDFAVGTGIPGLAMWCAFLGYLMVTSIRRFIKYRSYFALLLLFTVGNFGMRMVVDSNLRDHMLQQFIFLAGFFFTAMLLETKAATGGGGEVESSAYQRYR